MTKKPYTLTYNEVNLDYIILKEGKPVVITKEILIDFIQNSSSYSPVFVTLELLDKMGFDKSTNPINKDIYYDIGNTIARIIFDCKAESFRMNFKYSIKSRNAESVGALYFTSLNELQFNLSNFYGMAINPDYLMKALI